MSGRCVIPAAGLGTRLRPVTLAVAKELLPVGTRPVLQWALTEALEAGFDRIRVVTREGKESLEAYVDENAWREGLLPSLADAAEGVEVTTVRQAEPLGVVDAILSVEEWVEPGHAFAVYLPDNVRIAGAPPLTVDHLEEAVEEDAVRVACHRIGPEARHFYGDVGRAELDELVPAGERPRVTWLQSRGGGAFRATPEGAWRLLPRYAVTPAWMVHARDEAARARLAGEEADDVTVLRRLVDERRLAAVPWSGTMVDTGRPAGYLYAQHLLHEAGARERDVRDRPTPGSELLEIESPAEG